MAFGRTSRLVSSVVVAVAALALLAGCEDQGHRPSEYRAFAPLSPEALDLMRAKSTDQNAPMLIRAFKKEAELEVWKQKKDGKYVLFKTYPMCRWSGQLGPKVNEGDRQVPEGFYTITPGQMNPNSHYYLSFNVGYPNAYDRANGHTGGSIMVHGICSSAGCFSMTDKQIEEIYAVARESFAGGQRAIQMQSYPFRMTAENLAKLRLDPNMAFWRELKKGSDYFDVTKLETPVGVCNKKYVFGATPKSGSFDALSACPPLDQDPEVKTAVDAKASADDRETAELVGKGVKAVRIVYADGGQNESFKKQQLAEVSRPDALAAGASEIPIDQVPKGKPVAVQVAAMKAAAKQEVAKAASVDAKPTVLAANAPPGASVVPAAFAAAPSAYAKEEPKSETFGLVKSWLNIGSSEATPAPSTQVSPETTATTQKSEAASTSGKAPSKVIAAKAGPVKPAQTKSSPPQSDPKPDQVTTTAPEAAPSKSWVSNLMSFSPLD